MPMFTRKTKTSTPEQRLAEAEFLQDSALNIFANAAENLEVASQTFLALDEEFEAEAERVREAAWAEYDRVIQQAEDDVAEAERLADEKSEEAGDAYDQGVKTQDQADTIRALLGV